MKIAETICNKQQQQSEKEQAPTTAAEQEQERLQQASTKATTSNTTNTSTTISTNIPAAASTTQLSNVNGQLSPAVATAKTTAKSYEVPTNCANKATTRTNTTATTTKDMAAATATTTAASHLANENVMKNDLGVLDFTINATAAIGATAGAATATASASTSNNNNNTLKLSNTINCYSNNNNNNSNDIGRSPVAHNVVKPHSVGSAAGGRLQFFKDGKFILELARSKDGEKGGWVSVPRKLFRTPAAATSATVTPTSAPIPTYPKNENSTSLSFSDDNSSIQSSPWQRDHSWKQAIPHRNISKELSLYYYRPKHLMLSELGIQHAKRKRRRPYDAAQTALPDEIFELCQASRGKPEQSTAADPKQMTIDESNEIEIPKQEDAELDVDVEGVGEAEVDLKIKNEDASKNTDVLQNKNQEDKANKGSDVEDKQDKTKQDLNAKGEKNDESNSVANQKASKKENNDEDAKMNTSEDGDATMANSSDIETTVEPTMTNGKLSDADTTCESGKPDVSTTKSEITTAAAKTMTKAGEEKRLKNLKTRAKLKTIIQKLIDNMPARLVKQQLSKTVHTASVGGGNSIGNGVNALNAIAHNTNNTQTISNKVSPPSSASRLVEYHQQHVSPRKRILREFEKVTLEDSNAAAGGKRSRAKATATTSSSITATTSLSTTTTTIAATTSQFRNPKSPTSRSNCTNFATASSNLSYTSPGIANTTANGNCSSHLANNNKPKSSAAPTRLYSSYSIHSLLSGGSGSSSSNSSSSGCSSASSSSNGGNSLKKANEHATVISHHQQYNEAAFQSPILTSPKSPEHTNTNHYTHGGKSPLHSSFKKRSPPYASPLHESHSRSPAAHATMSDYAAHCSPRHTPPDTHTTATNYKLRYTHDANHPLSSSPHQQLQQQQHFYSPYMLTPPTAPSTSSLSPHSAVANTASARSPRYTNTYGATSTNSSSASTTPTTTANIPNTNNTNHSYASRDLSPPRSSIDVPRELTTPRTVPKKTASIRRQFASPTTTSAASSSSCPSPSDRQQQQQYEDTQNSALQHGRKTPVSSLTANQHLLHRSSPGNAAVAANINFHPCVCVYC